MEFKKMSTIEIAKALYDSETFFPSLLKELGASYKSPKKLAKAIYRKNIKLTIGALWKLRKLKKEIGAKDKMSAGRYEFSLVIKDEDNKDWEINGGEILVDWNVNRYQFQKRIINMCKHKLLRGLGIQNVFHKNHDAKTELINSMKYSLTTKLLTNIALDGGLKLEKVSHFH